MVDLLSSADGARTSTHGALLDSSPSPPAMNPTPPVVPPQVRYSDPPGTHPSPTEPQVRNENGAQGNPHRLEQPRLFAGLCKLDVQGSGWLEDFPPAITDPILDLHLETSEPGNHWKKSCERGV